MTLRIIVSVLNFVLFVSIEFGKMLALVKELLKYVCSCILTLTVVFTLNNRLRINEVHSSIMDVVIVWHIILLSYWKWQILKLTFASPSSSHFGWKKYFIPSCAPSKVKDFARKTMMKMNGNVAVKYLTLADDLILFQRPKYTNTQAHSKHATNSHLKVPKSWRPLLICRTLMLERNKSVLFDNISCEFNTYWKNSSAGVWLLYGLDILSSFSLGIQQFSVFQRFVQSTQGWCGLNDVKK